VIQADHTLTFIALKPGLLTGKARDVVGRLHHHALGLERWLAGQSTP
jgi:NAD(P)H-hydrate epimerase